MSKLTPLTCALLLAAACAPAGAQVLHTSAEAARRAPLVILDGTRETDGLRGPVRRVETEVIKVDVRQGRTLEGPASLLERTLYDERGRRVENETYPVVGGHAGDESHRYDGRGNVVETVVRDRAGAVLSRTTYEYEFDEHGNWTRMTASVAVSNRGRAGYEPFEITRRSITYYAVDDSAAGAPRTAATQNRNGASAAPVAAGEKVGERAGAQELARAAGPAGAPAAVNARKPLSTNAPAGGEFLEVGVLNARATWLPRPAYPVGSRRLEQPYTVAVEVTLDITGRVVGAQAQNGPPALRDAAERAARLSAFLPFYVSGRPVRARGVINYDFDYLP
ncbi:MAG TPA: energy transducer TonB [Pyrinomonadaceae bacterium]|nr:energy transducer TonB [Pyrinomonadaceae bacterium]